MNSRKIVAVFDSQTAAQTARNSLLELGFPQNQISITDRSSSEHTLQTPQAHGNFWAHMKEMFMPENDRHTIEESIRRGGHVLVATVEEARADEAVARLEQAGAVDLDQQESQWRATGWTGGTTSATTGGTTGATTGGTIGATTGGTTAESATAPRSAAIGGSDTASDATSVRAAGVRPESRVADRDVGDTIPVIQEKLRVGKREVNRGSVRVRSYIVEEPVHQEVRLREERVAVDRRPVNAPVRPVVKGSPEDLLQERTIEMTETAEQAVVGKEARVTEEVVVSKVASERVEQIDDTVRRTEVKVEDSRDPGTGRSRVTDPGASGRPGRS
jgi:uncharacterized protein (TIGR02271 family)